MRVQITSKIKKWEHSILRGISCVFLFCVMFMLPVAVQAQIEIPAEGDQQVATTGVWVFDRAVGQERPEGTQQAYTQRDLTETEFSETPHFQDIPVRMEFRGGYFATIAGAAWTPVSVLAVSPQPGVLEFRRDEIDQALLPDWKERPAIDRYAILAPDYFGLAINGNQLTMKCKYYYIKEKQAIEGILTIYYKR
jgi:hypothetical protein